VVIKWGNVPWPDENDDNTPKRMSMGTNKAMSRSEHPTQGRANYYFSARSPFPRGKRDIACPGSFAKMSYVEVEGTYVLVQLPNRASIPSLTIVSDVNICQLHPGNASWECILGMHLLPWTICVV
jgi:hypothetical protein